MTREWLRGVGLLLLVASVAACASMQAKEPTLYERIRAVDATGTTRQGRDAIAIVVDRFVANMVADHRVNARFKGMPGPAVEKLKSNLSDQICQASGGSCSYYGRDMKAAHTGMKITEAEWNATVENLNTAFDQAKVGERERKDLVAAIAPMKGDIVGQ
ncbi:MAG: group 1 truncated hemoglobin [Candidatus Rokubacteria bacterium]|nr:group 1 truncated hemoglobin [Candidatus Rokubacteria bacterium]